MEFKGKLGYLSIEEQHATGLASPVMVSEIDTVYMLASLDERRQGLEAMQATDGHELTNAERASIVPEMERLQHDSRVIQAMAGQITAHQAELFTKLN